MANLQHTLAKIAPIGLAEMDACALMNRTDTKYIFGRLQLPMVLEGVLDSYRVLSIEGVRQSSYLTLYFDTPDHECYLHHHNGKANRRKYRIREYCGSQTFFLELKTKNNKGRTVKRRVPIDGFQDPLSRFSLDFFESAVGRSLNLQSSLWTEFSRITLVNQSQPERTTIDFNLSFRTVDRVLSLPHLVVAEVKQERDNRNSPLREYLHQLHVRPMRMSKYCIGTALLNPQLKRNRFKPKLLAIDRFSES